MNSTAKPMRCPFASLEPCNKSCVFFDEYTERCDLATDIRDISCSLGVIENTLSQIEAGIPKPLRKHIRD